MSADILVSLMLYSLGDIETRQRGLQGSMELLLFFFFLFLYLLSVCLSTEGQNQEGKQRQDRQERCRGTALPLNPQDPLCCFLYLFPCFRNSYVGKICIIKSPTDLSAFQSWVSSCWQWGGLCILWKNPPPAAVEKSPTLIQRAARQVIYLLLMGLLLYTS